jgi:hypothetical protein
MAATKKTKKKRKTRASKRVKLETKVLGPETHMGYHLGQEVYCVCISDGRLGYGRITQFHLNCIDLESPEGKADCFSFVCHMRGSFQTSYLRDIIMEPTKKHINERNAAMAGGSKRRKKKD